MRLASYNVEWFNALFDDAGGLLEDEGLSARHEVTRGAQLAALGRVFGALEADAVLVIEAPDTNARRSTVTALERFAAHFSLRARAAVIGFANETQQEIALLYDPDVLSVRHDPRGDALGRDGGAPRFDAAFRIDLDIDDKLDTVRWSKPPLELELRTAQGAVLRLIGVHAKSKAPHGAVTADEVLRLSIANRRKQLAQCIWLRQRVEEHLAAGEALIVAGDFNDGPGLDEYEKLFGRSGVEIVLGDPAAGPALFDPHAQMALQRRIGAMPATARFWMRGEARWLSALLDYIMVSPDLRKRQPRWRIWHPFDDPLCYGDVELREALLTASDHFPVTLDIEI
jgi:hypothetical protein